MKSIFSHYKPEYGTSIDQLTKDFTDFPPIPLSSGLINKNIKTIYITKYGQILYAARVVWLLLLNSFNNPLKISDGFLKKINIKRKNLFGVLLIFWPVLFIGFAKAFCGRVGVYGWYYCLFDDYNETVVRIDRINAPEKLAAIVSHEHIHFLQGLHGKIFIKTNDIAFLIKEKYLSDRVLKYFMEHHETEARLHEVVVSYYRKNRVLPLNLSDFKNLLFECKNFGCYFESAFLNISDDIPCRDSNLFESRAEFIADDICSIVFAIKSDLLVYRYGVEVLSVMYGNLLLYYGDADASEIFLMGIPRPNMYDLLYSV
ncbi:MAG: hypothetical protein QG572_1332 [Pseudomonadota bacterium]|nr:hypothetical protein [Pseudomonadota bacterium]